MGKENFSKLLTELVLISPRRGKNEPIAADLIKQFLNKENIPFEIQEFPASVPVTMKAELLVDGKNIPCLGTSFVSGNITKNVSIQEPYEKTGAQEMIIYNPIAQGICAQSLKEIPALAVNVEYVDILKNSRNISGRVEVEAEEFLSQNILVGNKVNPKKIIFAHYDSIVGAGALDNAAAVDVLYQTIMSNKSLLNDYLFVFAGIEEESISNHDGYYGFEIFDKKYAYLMNSTEEIVILDGVGVSEPYWTHENIDWVFGIPRLSEIEHKTVLMENDQSIVRQYYHSPLDTIDIINQKYIDEARDLLISKLK
jgi:hypothetical protein